MRTDTTTELGAQHLLDAAERGAGYLAQNLLPGGQFVYRRDARTGQPITGKYDLARHFGALWALLDVRGYDPAVQAAAARATEWAINRHYEQTPHGGAFRAQGWLVTGCGGLALLALDELAPEHTRAAADDIRPELVDFLLAHQITDGALRHDFHHKIALRRLSVDLARADVSVAPQYSSFRGKHHSGQILFGLTTYLSTRADSFDGRQDRADQLRFAQIYTAAGHAMAALMARDHGVAQRSPWMMYAIRGFAELTDRLLTAGGRADDEPARAGRRDLLAWASRIAAGVLAAPRDEASARSLATAGRVQAQVQFLAMADAYAHELTDQRRLGALTASARYQVEQDCAALLHRQDPATGGFVDSAMESIMQIDVTQQAISALLGAAAVVRVPR